MVSFPYMPSATNGGVLGILWEIGGDVLRFPQWWYGRGLIDAARTAIETVEGYARRLGVKVWMKNLFTPMFGQYDAAGRIISFFVRVFQILVRSVLMLAAFFFALAVLFVYVALPIFVVWQIMRQFVLFFYAGA